MGIVLGIENIHMTRLSYIFIIVIVYLFAISLVVFLQLNLELFDIRNSKFNLHQTL